MDPVDPREERQAERLAKLEAEHERLTGTLAEMRSRGVELSGADRAKAIWIESRLEEIERWRRKITERLSREQG